MTVLLIPETVVDDTPLPDKMNTLLASSLHNPALLAKFHIPRFRQRLAVAQAWGVARGERILDIGCGQGESCLALAIEVGDDGHVTAIDPAQLDYGHPFTMREAHAHIQKSVLGSRISFYPLDTPAFLAQLEEQPGTLFDSAVLCHSLWYFPDEQVAHALFSTLAQAKIARLYLAEWSYSRSQESQIPHVLAAQVQALFYRYKGPGVPGLREQNVRAGIDQQSVLCAATEAGYSVVRERLITPDEDMLEGHFEVDFVLGPVFHQRIREANLAQSKEDDIHAGIEQVRVAKEKLASGGTTTMTSMDVWCAVLKLNQ